MKNTNSITTLILLICLLFVTGCKKEEKEPLIASGTTGDLTWVLSSDGTLTISGKGEMPDYITSPWAGYKESITAVEIKNGVTSIGDRAFMNCVSLKSVTIPNSVKSIVNRAFLYCVNLKSVTIPNSVTSIGDYTFSYCSGLTSVIIGNSVTNIGQSAFSRCTGLTSVAIPNSVTDIGSFAFSGCRNLTEISNYATTPQTIQTNVFKKVKKSKCVLRVPATSADAYRQAKVWKEFRVEDLQKSLSLRPKNRNVISYDR